jgi:hypothetical protein
MTENNTTRYSQSIPTVFTAYGFLFFVIGVITMLRPVWLYSNSAYSAQSELPLMLLGVILVTFSATLLYITILRKDMWLKPFAAITTILAVTLPILTQYYVFTFDRLADQLSISRTVLTALTLLVLTTPAVYAFVSMKKLLNVK